jgi:FtsH-binding integral membrane protein
LLSAQLLITVGIAAAIFLTPARSFVFANPWTFWASFGVSFGLILVLACSESARRSHPTNLIILFLFTACEAVLLGTISATYDTEIVLLAAGITAGATLVLSLYAMQTKHDFTAAGGILFGLLWALIAAGILSLFIHTHVMNIVISAVGAAVFSCYIVFDVQLMMGSGTYSISPDEYVFASLNIYLDIVNLFLYLLRLLSEIQGDR